MEKKKLQRVIGISVVVAFVIVLIPFLFGKREMPQQETTAQATTEQTTTTDTTTQVTAANTDQNQQPATIQDNTNNPNPTDTTNPNTQNTSSNADDNGITPITPDQNNAAANATQNPTDTTTKPATTDLTGQSTSAINQPAVNPANPINPDAANAANNTPANAPSTNETAAPAQDTMQATPAVSTDATHETPAQPTVEKTAAIAPVKEVKSKHLHKNLAAAKKAHHTIHQASINSKQPAWVVQMGSFKDKSNATRMAQQLKTSGFKVFTREVKSSSGNVRTRVYIGPEFKQASAQQLSTKIQRQTKLQGYVIPYKSIAL